jgi:hypothetical protein
MRFNTIKKRRPKIIIINSNQLQTSEMERTGGIAYYDLDSLCSEAVYRNFRGEGNTVGQVISAASYALVWNTFTG